MCGRFTQQRPASELAEIFGAEPLVDDPGGHFNVAPTDEALVVVQRDDRRAVTAYRWGLIPHWATDAKVGSRMFNARAETLTASPAFREAFRRRRCLVPVDAFYEWKREGTIRQPYLVDPGRRPAARAGRTVGRLARPVDRHRPPDLHDRDDHAERGARRPARSHAGGRLRGRLGALARAGAPAMPASCSACSRRTRRVDLRIQAVSRLVNDVRQDGPALVVPLGATA